LLCFAGAKVQPFSELASIFRDFFQLFSIKNYINLIIKYLQIALFIGFSS